MKHKVKSIKEKIEYEFPDKWCILITEDNYIELRHWMQRNSSNYLGYADTWMSKREDTIGEMLYSHGRYVWNMGDIDSQEITTEQFRKFNKFSDVGVFFDELSKVGRFILNLDNHEGGCRLSIFNTDHHLETWFGKTAEHCLHQAYDWLYAKKNPLPDGLYYGTWGGGVIDVEYKDKHYEIKTEDRVKGMGIKVIVEIEDGLVTFNTIK